MSINKTKQQPVEAAGHRNYMDGVSYFMSNPVHTLSLMAASSFFGEPAYYADLYPKKLEYKPTEDEAQRTAYKLTDGQMAYLRETLGSIEPQTARSKSPAEALEAAIDAALDYDLESTLELAARLRNEDGVRVTPQVILVRAANHQSGKGNGLVRRYAARIIKRADEPATVVAYQLERFGKPIPNSLKKALRDAFGRFDRYRLAKYRMEDRTVKTVDVVNLVHPFVAGPQDPIDQLVKGTLKNTDTWEAIISEKGSVPQAWAEAFPLMGHSALLKNVRNLVQRSNVPHEDIAARLLETSKGALEFPFRYYTAFLHSQQAVGVLRDALSQCIELSLAEMPRLKGSVASLCDNSGSCTHATTSAMSQVPVSSIGNIMAVLTGKLADYGWVVPFGDTHRLISVSKQDTTLTQLRNLELEARTVGPGTENGVWTFFRDSIERGTHYDHIFIYSDAQAGHGGLYGIRPNDYQEYRWGISKYIDVAKLVSRYRQQVNPKVLLYCIQIAGYADALMPEHYDRTFILGGWSPGVIQYAARIAQMYEQE